MGPTRQPNEARGAYAEVCADKLTADVAVLERFQEARRQHRMLALTDAVLGQLERRNLAGQRELDEVVRRRIAQFNAPPGARGRTLSSGQLL